MTKLRCSWVKDDPLLLDYHDREWGVPVHDDRVLFEFLILEGVQAGLSWQIVLSKREAYRQAFDQFDPHRVARYDETKIAQLLQNSAIIRNRLKINAAIVNARSFLAVQQELGSFDRYLWQFVGGTPIQNRWPSWESVPSTSAESELLSRDLKRRGFKFVGPRICYALMQGVGMVNDHATDCFRYAELNPTDVKTPSIS